MIPSKRAKPSTNKVQKLEAFSLIELVLVILIFASLLSFATPRPNAKLALAHHTLFNNLLFLKTLALADDFAASNTHEFAATYPSIDAAKHRAHALHGMWQAHFHQSGVYTQHSYSLYMDTARSSATTDFDGRPMSADIVPLVLGECLTGYNNTNTGANCKDNTKSLMRLYELFGVEILGISLPPACAENRTARVYFTDRGAPHCGASPTPLTTPFIIRLKKSTAQKNICISPTGEIKKNCE